MGVDIAQHSPRRNAEHIVVTRQLSPRRSCKETYQQPEKHRQDASVHTSRSPETTGFPMPTIPPGSTGARQGLP